MSLIETNVNIPVNDSESYNLTVEFGDGQQGSSSMEKFDGNFVVGKIKNEPIGSGSSLKNKRLIIASMVTDVNPDTNWTSITYFLNDTKIKGLSKEADKEHSSVFYVTRLNFI